MQDLPLPLMAPAQALHRPGGWQHLQPAFSRLGQPAARPEDVALWLAAPHTGSEFEAERAHAALQRQPWALQAVAGGFRLQAGAHAWQLQPVPAHQPAHWRVSRA